MPTVAKSSMQRPSAKEARESSDQKPGPKRRCTSSHSSNSFRIPVVSVCARALPAGCGDPHCGQHAHISRHVKPTAVPRRECLRPACTLPPARDRGEGTEHWFLHRRHHRCRDAAGRAHGRSRDRDQRARHHAAFARRTCRRRGVGVGAGDRRVPRVRAERRQGLALRDGSPHHVRRPLPLCAGADVRSGAGQHRLPALPPRRAHELRAAQARDRFVQRQEDRLPVRHEPGRREARLLRVQRQQRGSVVGRRMGRCHEDRLRRLGRGISHPVQPDPLRAW